MTSKIEKILTVVMAVAAVAVAARYLSSTPDTARASFMDAPTTARVESDWSLASKYILPRQLDGGSLAVIEYIDVECPFCAKYALTLDSAKQILGDTIEVYYVNMPLSSHRFARSGAAAIECAFRTPHGRRFVEHTYMNSDSIGHWTWAKMAEGSGIIDTAAFQSCLSEPAVHARVDSARSAALTLQIPGTPTVFLQGWRYDMPPRLERLLADVRNIAAGKDPE